MSSHVSMMDDVLISQLPPPMIRAALRHLVSACPQGSALLSKNIKKQFTELDLPLPEADQLYPGDLENGNSKVLEDFLALTRCLFSCHAVHECLLYLTHLFRSVPESQLKWERNSKSSVILAGISGDAVQAIQSVKEATPRSACTTELLHDLQSLINALSSSAEYCRQHQLPFPFVRAALSAVDAQQLLFPDQALGVDPSVFASGAIQFDLGSDHVNGLNIEQVKLGKLAVPRLFNGLWQMSSATAWGSAGPEKLDEHLLELVQSGFLATDMADHYGDAELIYGSFRNRLPTEVKDRVLAATKWCVFKPLNRPVTRELVLAAVEERYRRLGGRVDLLQFHWQDHSNLDYLKAIQYLVELTESRPDLVTEIGIVNFDAKDTEQVCKYMIENIGKVGIVSNQVQFSLIDSRPLYGLCAICEKYNVKLLTYGSFCGGFLSDRWLDKPSPDIYGPSAKLTPSQRKYFDSISEWGSWQEFQALLQRLKAIGDHKSVSISNVAARWVLEQPAVGVVIVGTRLGVSSNAEQNLDTFSMTLSKADMAQIGEVASFAKGQAFFDKIGDCGAEYH